MINSTELTGNWNQIKGILKQKYANLTDDDLLLAEGKMDETLGKVQIKLGKTKEELDQILSELNKSDKSSL